MKKLVSVSIAVVALMGAVSTAQADSKTYKMACAACHATGVNNAPKFGNKADWAPRIKKGMPALFNSALKGTAKGMPPKGGRMDLSDAVIKSTVTFMVNAAK